MQYYGTRLSENLSLREPEGYLLCLNVPVARTGTQEYLPQELGLPPARGDPLIPVVRPPEEVFSPATIASFEGMPVTNDHPPDGVTLENVRYLSRGHAHNVRRGTGEMSDLLLADLIIQDRTLIDAILKDGKREISCGYLYELREENGQYVQRNIRGNHIAVVDAGRAGPRVSIRDEEPSKSSIWVTVPMLQPSATDEQCLRSQSGERRSHEKPKTERSLKSMKKSLYKKLVRMARDGDAEAIEAVAEIVENLTEELPAAPAEAPETIVVGYPPEAPAETPAEETEASQDSDPEAAILERLDRIIALLTPAAADEESDPVSEIAEAVAKAVEAGAAAEAPADADTREIAEIMEEVLEPSTVLEPEQDADECEEQNPLAADAVRAALKAVRPAIARMPKEQRKQVCGEIARRLRRTAGDSRQSTPGAYAALARAGRKDRAADPAELGRRIMASRNINCRV
ncbi:MAG: DUF2213 domain-containing protein [Clostridia bacterium]|nr:DUF2213 domain-containing protein [Clostridia bacterium]